MDCMGVQFDPSTKKVLFNPSTQKALMARILHIYSGSIGGVKKDLYKGLSNPLWSYAISTDIDKVSLDAEENVYCVGSVVDSKNIWKLDRHGNLLWSTLQGGNLLTCGIDGDGNLVVAGYENDGKHIWKINQEQELQWSYDCGAVERVCDLVIDNDGNIYAAGGGTVYHEYVYWKLNPAGELQWRINYASSLYGTGRSIAHRNAHDYVVTKGEGGFLELRKSDGVIVDNAAWAGGDMVEEITVKGSSVYYATRKAVPSGGGIEKFSIGLVWQKTIIGGILPRDIDVDNLGNCVVSCADGVKVIANDGTVLWSHGTGSYGVAIRTLYDA